MRNRYKDIDAPRYRSPTKYLSDSEMDEAAERIQRSWKNFRFDAKMLTEPAVFAAWVTSDATLPSDGSIN
jgi:hypothetical protein